MAPGPLRASKQPICPGICRPVCLSVWLSTGMSICPCVIHVSLIKPWKRRAGARLQREGWSYRQRDTVQGLMTHYNYTYSSPPAEHWNATEMVLMLEISHRTKSRLFSRYWRHDFMKRALRLTQEATEGIPQNKLIWEPDVRERTKNRKKCEPWQRKTNPAA